MVMAVQLNEGEAKSGIAGCCGAIAGNEKGISSE